MAYFQFIGKQQVIAAYESRDAEIWSLWQGKSDMLMKGQGSQELNAFLTMIEQCRTTAVYTLRVYEDLGSPKDVKSKTEDDGRFSFKLFDESGSTGTLGSIIGTHYGLPDSNTALLERIKALEEAKEPAEKKFTISGFIEEVVSDPETLEQYINIIKGIISPNSTPQQTMRPAIGYVERMGQTEHSSPAPAAPIADNLSQTENMNEQQLEQLGKAIDILHEHDPKIIEHLEKLAIIAKENPKHFKLLLTMLEAT